MDFPKHKASMTLQHNDHLGYYMTVAQWVEDQEKQEDPMYEWKSDEDKQQAIDTNELWTLQWYPSTPGGFYAVAAPTLDKAIAFSNEELN